MTETALKNKDMVMRDKREREISALDRGSRERIAKEQAKAGILSAGIGAMGTMGGAALKSLGTIYPKGTPTSPARALNDPSWYTKNPSGVKALNTMPTDIITNHVFKGSNLSLPSVGCLYYVDHFGPTFIKGMTTKAPTSQTSINAAASTMMTLLREWNSRIGEYQPSDLFQLLYAINELYRFLLWGGRAVRAYYHFDTFKPAVRRSILFQMFFDADDFIANAKNYEKFIQTEIQGLNTDFVLPADVSLFTRKNFLAWNFYKEGEGDNSQYLFAQHTQYGVYSETDGAVKFTQVYASTVENPDNKMTYSGFVTAFADMKAAILSYSKYVTFIADMRTAVRNGMKQFALPELELHKLNPQVVDEVLTQIMNANTPILAKDQGTLQGVNAEPEENVDSWCTYLPTYSVNQLGQDSAGFLEPQNNAGTAVIPYVTTGNIFAPAAVTDLTNALKAWNDIPQPLNFYKNNLTVEDVMVATRFAPQYTYSAYISGTNNRIIVAEVRYGGSEIPLCMSISYQDTSVNKIAVVPCHEYNRAPGVPIIGLLAGFNYRPLIKGPSVDSSKFTGVFGFAQNWDKVLEYSKDQSYWFDDLAVKSELYPAAKSINPGKGKY